jgi:1-acyl-sn-glycerol-3-phosphate acyltransferase
MKDKVLKGIYIRLAFLVFLLGVSIEFIFLPVILLTFSVIQKDKYPLHTVNRLSLSFFLGFLKAGRLIQEGKVIGKPYDGTCVVISNHPGLLDVFFLIREIPSMSVMVNSNIIDKLPIGFIIRNSGYVLAPGKNQPNPLKAINGAKERLREGLKFLVFPEGTRSPVNGLHRFKRGAFYLAKECGVPIQPVIIASNPYFLPKGKPFLALPNKKPFITVEFLPPLYVGDDINSDIKKVTNLYKEKLNLD